MGGWFTVETIDADTYAISEYRHWEHAHSYLVLGREKAALIDTGLGVGDIGAVVKRLTGLPVQVLTTHVHWDHIGGHRHFAHFGVHALEKSWISGGFPVPLRVVKASLLKDPCAFPADFDAEKYTVFQGRPNRLLRDGDTIRLGGRSLRVLHTPGHSPGHVCFYEEATGYLFSGDLIYAGKLDAFYPSTDPLAFRNSVRKVSRMSVSRILPGHHALDIPVSLIRDIDTAFDGLYQAGRLVRGSGIFEFGEFRIHI